MKTTEKENIEKSIVFDTGPIISLATNNLLWILEILKERYGGKFYITEKVKEELVDKPLSTKKFRFEAIQIVDLISKGVLEIYTSPTLNETSNKILKLANSCFEAQNTFLTIVHPAETEVLACAKEIDADAIVIDETTTRYLIEAENKILDRFKKKLHMKIKVEPKNILELKKYIKGINVIRSFELCYAAYKMNLFDKFTDSKNLVPQKEYKKDILSGVLWALKLNGCSVKEDDIEFVVSSEKY